MPVSSKKISRLEKEAILRSKVLQIFFQIDFMMIVCRFPKDSEYKREQAAGLFNDSYQDEETFEYERHRRFNIIRQTHQIQRDIDRQVGLIDKLNVRKQQELQKKTKGSTSSSTDEPQLSTAALIEKYAKKKNDLPAKKSK